MIQESTICAIATPAGQGALGIIRISGHDTFNIMSKIIKGKNLIDYDSHTLHFCKIYDNEEIIDEVIRAFSKLRILIQVKIQLKLPVMVQIIFCSEF